MISIGVIGYGYWGPNIVRNFQSLDLDCVKMVCDLNPKVLDKVKR
jgi:6-phosphogluconate dehydrogenase (decarboxylating)